MKLELFHDAAGEGFLKKLFPEGQRKLIVSLLALVIAIVLEKFSKTGLTDNMQESLIAIVAIFTGGNVMEHLSAALKVFKGTKVGELIEDVVPGDQGLGKVEAPQKEETDDRVARDLERAYNEFVQFANQTEGRFQQMQTALSTHAENTQKIVGMIDRINKTLSQGEGSGKQRA